MQHVPASLLILCAWMLSCQSLRAAVMVVRVGGDQYEKAFFNSVASRVDGMDGGDCVAFAHTPRFMTVLPVVPSNEQFLLFRETGQVIITEIGLPVRFERNSAMHVSGRMHHTHRENESLPMALSENPISPTRIETGQTIAVEDHAGIGRIGMADRRVHTDGDLRMGGTDVQASDVATDGQVFAAAYAAHATGIETRQQVATASVTRDSDTLFTKPQQHEGAGTFRTTSIGAATERETLEHTLDTSQLATDGTDTRAMSRMDSASESPSGERQTLHTEVTETAIATTGRQYDTAKDSRSAMTGVAGSRSAGMVTGYEQLMNLLTKKAEGATAYPARDEAYAYELELTVSHRDISPGEMVEVTLTFRNTGANPVQEPVILFALPRGLVFAELLDGGVSLPGTPTLGLWKSKAIIDPGERWSVRLQAICTVEISEGRRGPGP